MNTSKKSVSRAALSAAGRACGIDAKHLDLALRGDHALVLGWRQPDELVFVLEGSPAAAALARGVALGGQVYGNREGAIHEVGAGETLVQLARAPSAIAVVVKALAGVPPLTPPVVARDQARPAPVRSPAPRPKQEGSAITAGFVAEQRREAEVDEDPAEKAGTEAARQTIARMAAARSATSPRRAAAPMRKFSLAAQGARAAAERAINEDEPPSAA